MLLLFRLYVLRERALVGDVMWEPFRISRGVLVEDMLEVSVKEGSEKFPDCA